MRKIESIFQITNLQNFIIVIARTRRIYHSKNKNHRFNKKIIDEIRYNVGILAVWLGTSKHVTHVIAKKHTSYEKRVIKLGQPHLTVCKAFIIHYLRNFWEQQLRFSYIDPKIFPTFKIKVSLSVHLKLLIDSNLFIKNLLFP